MPPDSKLTRTTLALSANAALRSIARTYREGGGRLSAELVERKLPGEVLRVAVEAKWISTPPAPKQNSVELGGYTVSKAFQDGFLAMLQPSLDALRLDDYEAEWMSPTPRTLIKKFKMLMGWSDQDLADAARAVAHDYKLRLSNDAEAISVKTLRRIQSERGKERHNAKRIILVALTKVMQEKRPKEFKTLHWVQLAWRKAQ